MPVRQLSTPSVAASTSSSSETVTSTTRILVTTGESASGAVGSSTTISISVLDIGVRYLSSSTARAVTHSGDDDSRRPGGGAWSALPCLLRHEARLVHQRCVEL